jgi:uracil phosphoribosyltransferase
MPRQVNISYALLPRRERSTCIRPILQSLTMPSLTTAPEPKQVVNVIKHASLKAKLAQLEDRSTPPAEVRRLVAQATTILAVNATADVEPESSTVLVPVMRSGLAMVDPFLDVLAPAQNVTVHHLGLFRDPSTLQAVEYYNNIPTAGNPARYAFVVDPLIATGATVSAAIDSLKYVDLESGLIHVLILRDRQWKVENIIVVALLATHEALDRVKKYHGDSVRFFVGDIQSLDENGRVTPGVGDMGDRLYF